LPSNLRQTTRECAHLVTRGDFPLRDKEGGHTIRFVVSDNSVLRANFMALCYLERELLPINFLHCAGIAILDFYCSCDLDLDPMTFIYAASWVVNNCATETGERRVAILCDHVGSTTLY